MVMGSYSTVFPVVIVVFSTVECAHSCSLRHCVRRLLRFNALACLRCCDVELFFFFLMIMSYCLSLNLDLFREMVILSYWPNLVAFHVPSTY